MTLERSKRKERTKKRKLLGEKLEDRRMLVGDDQPYGLVAFFPFDDPSVTTESSSEIGSVVGVFDGATYSSDSNGRTGTPGDYSLDTSGGGARIASPQFLNDAATNGDLTVAFWQKLDSVVQSVPFIGKSPSSTYSTGLSVHAPWTDNRIYFDTRSGPGNQRLEFQSPMSLTGAWHHFAFVQQGGSKSVWIDGKRVGSGSGAPTLPTDFNHFIIGGNPGFSPNGLIDDFAVFSEALPDYAIAQLAEGQAADELQEVVSPVTPTNPHGLVGYFPFDDVTDPSLSASEIGDPVGELFGATFSADGTGRSGGDGNHALDTSNGYLRIDDAEFMNKAGYEDEITISFWQKLDSLRPAYAFRGESPSVQYRRGISAHAPWTTNDIIYDTGISPSQAHRLSFRSPKTLTDGWHHFAFTMNDYKAVWIDGVYAGSSYSPAGLLFDFENFYIGGIGSNTVDGMIDDFAVFASVLPSNIIAEIAAGRDISSLVQDVSPVSEGNPSGLVTYLPFDDDSAPSQATSSVGADIASLVGASYSVDGGGRTGQAGDRSLDSTNGYAELVGAEALKDAVFDGRVTVSFWQKLDSIAPSASVYAYSPSSSDNRGLLVHAPWTDGKVYFDAHGTGANQRQYFSRPGLNDGDWHHFAFVQDGNKRSVWIDGVREVSGAGFDLIPGDLTTLRIGGSSASSTVDGVIDDFAIFATALPESSLLSLALGQSPLNFITNPTDDESPSAVSVDPFVQTPAPDGMRIRLATIAGDKTITSLPIPWEESRGALYLVEKSKHDANRVEIRDGDKIIASLDFGYPVPATLNLWVDYLTIDGGETTIRNSDQHLFASDYKAVVATNPNDATDLALRNFRDELDQIPYPDLTGPEANLASSYTLNPQALIATLKYTAADYFQRFNQRINGKLADERWQSETSILVTGSNSAAVNMGGEFHYAIHDLKIFEPANNHVNWSTSLSDDDAAYIADASARSMYETLRSVTGEQTVSSSELIRVAESQGQQIHRWKKIQPDEYVDLESGNTVASATAAMNASGPFATEIQNALDDGFIVRTHAGAVTLHATSSSNNWTGTGAQFYRAVESGVEFFSRRYWHNGSAHYQADSITTALAGGNQPASDVLPGKVYRSDFDVAVPSIGINAQIARQYQSGVSQDVGFGAGWSFTYGANLELTSDDSTIIWNLGDGTDKNFTVDTSAAGPDHHFTADDEPGLSAVKHTVNGTVTYSVTTKDGTRFDFHLHGTLKARLVAIYDRNGNKHEINYNGNNLASIVDATVTQAPETLFTFTHTGDHISSVTDNALRMWTYHYETLGGHTVLTEVRGPGVTPIERQIAEYSYDLSDNIPRLLTASDGVGNSTQYTYAPNGRLRSSIDGSGNRLMYRYDDFNLESTVSDLRGFVARQTFDSQGRVISITSSSGAIEKLEYAGDERLVTKRIANDGTETTYQYDSFGNQIQTITNGLVTDTVYDPIYNLALSVTQSLAGVANSSRTLFTSQIDGNGNVISLTDALGNTINRTYTSRGLLQSETSARGTEIGNTTDYTTSFQYNLLGQVTQKNSPGSAQETFTYDANHNLAQYTNPNGKVTHYEYDLYGRVIRVESPDPHAGTPDATGPVVTLMTYDDLGRLISETAPEGTVTTYMYDAASRPISVSTGDSTETFEYDAAGNVTRVTDASDEETRHHYDGSGRKIATYRPDGTTTLIQYDSLGRVLRNVDALGQQTSWEYDAATSAITVTYPEGGTSTQEFDGYGNLIKETSPAGAVTTHSYDVANRVVETRFADQWIQTYQYDANGQIVSSTQYDVSGIPNESIPVDLNSLDVDRIRSRSISYSPSGRPTHWTNPDGGIRTAEYNTSGQMVAITNENGLRQEFDFGAAGNVSSVRITDGVTGANDRVIQNVVDSLGRLIERRTGSGTTPNYTTSATLSYDALTQSTIVNGLLGNSVTVDSSSDGRTSVATDSAGRLITTLRDSAGRTLGTTLTAADENDSFQDRSTSYEYDDAGRLESWTDPLGNVSNVVYDAVNKSIIRLSPELTNGDPDSRLESQEHYNSLGQTIRRVDPDGNVTTYSYDTVGRLQTTTLPDPDGNGPLPAPSITNTYNGFGDVIAQVDHLGRTTSFTYDAAGRIESITTPDPDQSGPLVGRTTTRVYDFAGNILSATDQMGRTTSWQYDSHGRVTKETLPDPDPNDGESAPETTYTYDSDGRVARIVDVTGGTTDFEYDDLGREIKRTLPEAYVGEPRPEITRGYDAGGNVIWVTDASGETTHFTYDIAGQLLQMTLPDPDADGPLAAPARSYTYDAAGRVASFTDEAGVITGYNYDSLGRLVSQTTSDPDGEGPLAEFSTYWSYDANGNVLTLSDSLGRSSHFTYDALGREISQTRPDPDLTVPSDTPIFYKAYDPAGNLTSVTDALGRVTALEYDDAGRLVRQTAPSVDGVSPVTEFQYDQAGNLVAVTDPLGRMTTHEYDHWNRRVKTYLPDLDVNDALPALSVSQSYDNASRIVSKRDSADRETSYVYDGRGQLVQTIYRDLDPNDGIPAPSISTEYDVAGRVVATTDTLGRQTKFTHDALGRITAVILPAADGSATDGPTTHSVYDDSGNLVSSIDPLGRVTSFTYDDWGREILKTHPDPDGSGPLPAPTIQTIYDAAGNIEKTIDHLGRQTVTQYDRLDRPVLTTYPDPDLSDSNPAPTFTRQYDVSGALVSETDALGRITSFQYDALGRLIQTTLPDPDLADAIPAPTTSQQYDLVGNILARTDQDGATTTWTYDALGRTLSETYADPDGNGPAIAPTKTFAYDNAGNVLSESVLVATGTSLMTSFGYDTWNRQVQVTAPEGDITQYQYDTEGNLLAVTDGSTNTTSYTYDALNQQITSTNEAGAVRTYVYDDAGRLTHRTDRNGRVTQYIHDDLDRLTHETWLDTTGTTIEEYVSTFNDAGLLDSISDGDVNDVFTYDNAGRLIQSARSGGGLTAFATFAYTYDLGDQLTSIAQSVPGNSDVTTNYSYDDAGRIQEIVQSGPSITTKRVEYERSQYGQVIGLDRFLGTATAPSVSTDVLRDAIGRRTAISHRQGNTILADYSYTYDASSRVTAVDSLTDGLTSLTLDDNGRLTTADHSAIPDESFQYDATGNRVDTDNVNGTNNKLLSDGNFNYEYDAEGNRTARVDIATGERTEFTYDHRNRITFVERLDSSGNLLERVEYTYDSANHRTGRAVDSDADGFADVVERFVVDGDTVVAVVDETGDITNQFFHGAVVDEVLADENAAGDVTWTLADANKTIRDLAQDISGATQVVNHRVYDSFGNLHSQSNPSVDHLFGFTGRDYDEATGLHYYRDRWMDPVSGLFLSEDPLGFDGGDLNLMNYVGGAPHDYTDPTGNSWLSSVFKKVSREFNRVINQIADVVDEAFDDIGDFLEEARDDVRDFADDHPYLTAGIALATGAWFVSAAGGFIGAAAKLSALASKAVGSISTAWAPASSGIGGTFSINVGSFASVNVGAGISGTSAFASANVSVLGLPVAGVGKSIGAFGKISNPFASTLVGNFTDSVLSNSLGNVGQFSVPSNFVGGSRKTHSLITGYGMNPLDVGSFLPQVANDTAYNFGYSQLNQTGLPMAYSIASQTAAFGSDVYGAFQDVSAPPPSVHAASQVGARTDDAIRQVDYGAFALPDGLAMSLAYYEDDFSQSSNKVRTADETLTAENHWGDSYFEYALGMGGAGLLGIGQGILNFGNSVTDLVADAGNAVTSLPNGIANGYYYLADVSEHNRMYVPKIPKGDWAKDTLVYQDETSFAVSKISVGAGAQILTGTGLAKLAQAPGWLGRVGTTLEALDIVEGTVSSAKGVHNAYNEGLDWSNGSQIILGSSSLSGNFAEPLEDALGSLRQYRISLDTTTLNSGLPIGGVKVIKNAPNQGLRIPQGLSPRQFDRISAQIRSKADDLGLGSDVFVQGSRASGTARATSDIDIAIRVSPERFDSFINNPQLSRLSNPRAGSKLADTRSHALQTGKIQSGEARLSRLRTALENGLGIDVDLSVIRRGGQFDNGVQSPLSFGF
ncbi:LamG-like jellyroll fold domain-containing protein [Novipirellula caenicola]